MSKRKRTKSLQEICDLLLDKQLLTEEEQQFYDEKCTKLGKGYWKRVKEYVYGAPAAPETLKHASEELCVRIGSSVYEQYLKNWICASPDLRDDMVFYRIDKKLSKEQAFDQIEVVINLYESRAFDVAFEDTKKRHIALMDRLRQSERGEWSTFYVPKRSILAKKAICDLKQKPVVLICSTQHFKSVQENPEGHATCAIYWPESRIVEFWDPFGIYAFHNYILKGIKDAFSYFDIPVENIIDVSSKKRGGLQLEDAQFEAGSFRDYFCQTWIWFFILMRTSGTKCSAESINKFLEALTPEERYLMISKFWAEVISHKYTIPETMKNCGVQVASSKSSWSTFYNWIAGQ